MIEKMLPHSLQEQVTQQGFGFIKQGLPLQQIQQLHKICDKLSHQYKNTHGIRHLLDKSSEIKQLAYSDNLLSPIKVILGQQARPVRAIYFNKSQSDTNWAVVWHQDLSIAVKEKVPIKGYQAWSVKQGVVHVQPPEAILKNILTIRIHLDPVTEQNGVLKVIPCSHQQGYLNSTQISQWVKKEETVLCSCEAGDLLFMQPLLLHASGKSQTNKARRIIHIEYAGADLPAPLAWYED